MDTHLKKHMCWFSPVCAMQWTHIISLGSYTNPVRMIMQVNIWTRRGSESMNPLSGFACQWSCRGQACLPVKCTPGNIGRAGSQGPEPPLPQPGPCPAFAPHAPQAFHSFSSPDKQVNSEVLLYHSLQHYPLTENLSRRDLPGNNVTAGAVAVMVVIMVVNW